MPLVDDDFDQYASARWPTLVRSAQYLGCSRSDAEDLAQEALIRAYQRWPRVIAARDPDAYVYRILFNSFAKKRKRFWIRERPTPREDLDVERSTDHAVEVSTRVSIRAALNRLPVEQRAVDVLRFYADLTERQVSDVIGIPLGTVKSRASRALNRLGAELERSALHHPRSPNG